MAIQEELDVQPEESDQLDELYEEGPRRRPWAAIANVVLALAVVFVGYQWNEAASRARALGAEAQALRTGSESLRLGAEEHNRQIAELQNRLAALTQERSALEQRLGSLERSEAAAARPPRRPQQVAAAKESAPARVPVKRRRP